jgi:exo-1,4-beta-D-glucosaminidase
MYDWYLRPGGSYFGVKKACEPLHVQYSYDDHSIVVVNSYYRPFTNLKVTAKVYNLDMKEKFTKDAEVSVAADSSTRVFALPTITGLSPTYFVSLTLEMAGQTESRNFYWLSTREETLDWSRQELDASWQYDISTWTPTKEFADYTELNKLPRLDLDASAEYKAEGEEGSTTVTLHNPASTLAFGVRLKVNRAYNHRVSREGEADDEVLPVLWQDNYFVLLPGETRKVAASFHIDGKGSAVPNVEIEGWNVNRKTVGAQPGGGDKQSK